MAYAKNRIIDTLEHEIKDTKLPDEFNNAINQAMDSHTAKIVNNPQNDGMVHIIYPAKDKNNDVFAVLIQSNKELDFENQRLIHALLKVYSNYSMMFWSIKV